MIDFRRRTDALAVRRVLSGDRNSFGTLVDRYQSLVYHVALAHVGDPSDAEDLAQDAFLKAFRSLDTLRDARRFSAWIVTITRNVSRDFLKRRSIRAEQAKTLEEPEPHESPIEEMETRRILWRHIDQLGEMQRELLVLHHFEGKSARELAAIYNISTSACAKRLQRARQTLGAEMLKTLGLAAERTKPKDVSKRIMGIVVTVPVAWETAAAATAQSAGTAFAGIGLLKIGAILSVVAVTLGVVMTTVKEETSPAPIVEQAPSADMEIAALESEAVDSTEPSPSASSGESPASPSGVVDTISGRSSDPRNIGGGEIFGVVLDESGSPVADVLVVIDGMKDHYWMYPDESEARQSQTTNLDGEFAFSQLPAPSEHIATTYQVMAFADGKSAVEDTHFTSPGVSKELTLRLQPSRRISGIVFDIKGIPLQGAQVYPVRKASEEGDEIFRGIALRTVSNGDGRFSIRGLTAEKWQLVATAEGYAPSRSDFIESGVEDLQFRLAEGGSVRGQVVDVESGEGLGGVQVLLMGKPGFGSTFFSRHKSTTDEDGYYLVTNLEPKPHQTRLATLFEDTYVYPADGPTRVDFEIRKGEETLAPLLEVMRGGVVAGRVLDPSTGDGLQNVQVTILINRTVAPAPAWSIMRTDAEGRYRFAGLRHGEHLVYLEKQFQHPKSVTIEAGELVENLDFFHKHSAWMAGVVVDLKGDPVESAKVQTQWMMAGANFDTTTDINGRFEIRGMAPADSLYVYATTTRYRSEPVGPLDVPREGLSDVTLTLSKPRTASVEGIVVDARGWGIANANVLVESPSPLFQYGGRTRSDERGAFRIDRLVAGSYTIQVVPPEQLTWVSGEGTYELTLAAGEEKRGIRVVHAPGGFAISGTVVDARNQPIKGVNIYASGAKSESSYTDKDGRYNVAGLKEGVYHLSATHEKYSRASLSGVAAGSSEADFVLKARGAIAGRVVRADTGEPVEQFEIFTARREFYFLRVEFVRQAGSRFKTIRSTDGSFVLEDIDVGPNTVIVQANGLSPGFATVEYVRPGETTDGVVVRLQPGLTVEGRIRDSDGKPIAGADIFLGTVHNYIGPETGDAAALSRADGTFALASLPDTVRVITVVHPNYAAQVAPLKLLSERRYAPLDVVLVRGGIVEGTFLVDGEAPSYRQHGVSVQYPSQPDAVQAFTRADPSGHFRITGVRPGAALVRASFTLDEDRRQRLVQSTSVTIEEGVPVNVDFNMTTGEGVVEGRVLDPNDPPLGYSVLVSVDASDGNFSYEAPLDSEGNYRAVGVPSGRVTIQYPSQAGGYQRFAHDIGFGELLRQDIEITGSATIAYEVDQRVSNASTRVLLLPDDMDIPAMSYPLFRALESQALDISAIITFPWRHKFRGLEPGTYTLVALSADSWTEEGIETARYATATVTVQDEEVFVPFVF